MVNRTPIILIFAFSQLIPGSVWAQGYFLEDFQYFKPIVANVRTPQNHVRLYRAGEVPFSNSTSQGDHWFVDASFGERFSLLGYGFSTTNQEPFRSPGVSMFVDGASHLLIDLNTESRDVINADYQVGLGVAVRLPFARFLAFPYRFFHESAHIGDEYTLFASPQPSFRRYNISYEANELYAAMDHRAPPFRSGVPQARISYMRAYAGFRRLNTDRYAGFTGLFEPASPILLDDQKEYHVESIIDADDPPLIMIHGTADPTVPFSLAEAVEAQALSVGLIHEFYPLAGVGHGTPSVLTSTVVDGITLADRIRNFFYAHLELGAL